MDDNREIKIENKAYKSFDNFWYYHKWHVIVALFVIIAIVICTAQACQREKEDIKILYAGPSYIDTQSYNELNNTLSSLLPSDFDGDGKKNAGLVKYQIMSQEEIEKIESGDEQVRVDRGQNTSNMSAYTSYLMTGDVSICFVSEYLYKTLKDNDRLLPLSEIFDEMPKGAVDGCGIRLSSTDLYKYESSVRVMSGDTVICLLRQTVVGESSNNEKYANAKETFKAIVGFKVVE